MSVIIRVDWEGVTYDLDIQEDIPLRLDISAIENTEIGEFFGVGSQTFDLPGTKNNNKFFKHAYNVGGEDVPAFYNTIDGRIISRGETLLKGQFQLLEVVKDESGYVVYKCQIADETVQFKDAIQNKLIKNADWSSYSHTLNTGSILDSWQNNLLGGKVFYPLADYGYNDPESQGDYPLFAFGDGSTGTFFNNPLTPIQPAQFLPAVRAKDVLEVVCAQAGFSASGDFINSSDFSNLYILPKAKEEIGITITGSEQAIGYVTNNFNQTIPIGSTNQELSLNNVINDPLGKFFTSGSQEYGYYLADGNGEYEVRTQIGFFNPVSFTTGEVKVKLTLMRGSFPFSGTVIASEERVFSSLDGFNTFTLNVGGKFTSTTSEEVWSWVDYTVESGSPTNDLNLFGFSSVLQVTSAPEVYNDATVDMALQWPADLKSIDIIKGLIQQFNLVVYPSPDQDKTIIFEQFDEWIRKGQVKDWTEKWDTAVRTSINHTVDEQPQELILGNEEDSDRFSVEAKESDPYFQYGTLRILTDNNVSQGSRKIKNTFGPTVLGGPFVSGSVTAEGNPTYNIDLGSSFAFPHLYKFENNQLKSYKFRPRIGYKSNNTFPSGSQYKLALGTGYGDVTIVTGSYGTLSNVNGLPAQDGAADLHFNNSYFKFAGPGLNLGNTTSNFDTYWKTYIDSLYWDGNRKVTLDVKLNTQEYKDLRLNDIIFIKDQQYRINKIEGFNLTEDDVVTVELIRLYPQYYQNNPDCDFLFSVDKMDCDFTFEAEPFPITPTPTPVPTITPTPTPSPTPFPIDLRNCLEYTFVHDGSALNYTYYYVKCGQNVITLDLLTPGQTITHCVVSGSVAFNPLTTDKFLSGSTVGITSPNDITVTTGSSCDVQCDEWIIYNNDGGTTLTYSYWDCFTESYTEDTLSPLSNTTLCAWYKPLYVSGPPEYNISIGLVGTCPIPTPTPTPSPTPTPTPVPTATPTPSPTPQVYSYTGLVDYGSYNNACSGSTEVTIYTQGPIGTGSIAYEDASLTNVFDFYKFFIDSSTGIGYEFVDPNTTGQVIDTLNDACNVEVFNLYIDFNQYDACAESVSNIVYAAPGSTLTNGTVLYEDINLQYSWWGQTGYEIKFIESGSSPRQIYYNTATGVSASGTDVCFTVNSFNGWDSTATTPPAATCGDYDEVFYVQDTPQVGDNIFTDADLTDPIFTGEKWVYNDDANELYKMSGSTGGDGTGWVIGEITSSYCTPATPTPSPTPAPLVTQMSVSASWSSYYDACNNPGFTGTLYHTQIWDSNTQDYVAYFYEDNTQTTIFDFYQYVVDTSTGIGYQLPDPNTTGRVISTGSDVCNPGIFSFGVEFNEYEACTGCVTTTKYSDSSTFQVGMDLYTDIELEYDWTEGIGIEFVWSGSLYEYDGAARFGGNGVVDLSSSCYTINAFSASDSTATTAPTWFCGATAEKTLYVKDTPGVGKQVFTDSCLTDTVNTSQLWIYNHDTNELYGYNGTISSVTSSYCVTPTPVPTPTPTPAPQWYVLRGELCSQTSTVTYYNWYGDLNNFPAALFYDSNTGYCNDVYLQSTGYNGAYDVLDCSSRYEYYNTCSDCQSGINQQPCT